MGTGLSDICIAISPAESSRIPTAIGSGVRSTGVRIYSTTDGQTPTAAVLAAEIIDTTELTLEGDTGRIISLQSGG